MRVRAPVQLQAKGRMNFLRKKRKKGKAAKNSSGASWNFDLELTRPLQLLQLLETLVAPLSQHLSHSNTQPKSRSRGRGRPAPRHGLRPVHRALLSLIPLSRGRSPASARLPRHAHDSAWSPAPAEVPTGHMPSTMHSRYCSQTGRFCRGGVGDCPV